jgi:DNA gyrase inhibitor GyrI
MMHTTGGKLTMTADLNVRLVTLEPLRVAALQRYSETPELDAWRDLLAWADAKGLTQTAPRYFGFDNPMPTHGTPLHGYEVWMTVADEVQPDETVQIKVCDGGLYAVTQVIGTDNIFNTWMALSRWVETSPYQAQHQQRQCLEEHLRFGTDIPTETFVLDLYLPVKA